MQPEEPAKESEVVWSDRPWILPGVAFRWIFGLGVGVLLSGIEVELDLASSSLFSLPLILVTNLAVLAVLLLVSLRLVVLRASNSYTLRQSSLEMETGIGGKKLITISAAGFSDLEVSRGVPGRILNVGTIRVRSDSGKELTLRRIRDPIKVSSMLRDTLSAPVVRLAKE